MWRMKYFCLVLSVTFRMCRLNSIGRRTASRSNKNSNAREVPLVSRDKAEEAMAQVNRVFIVQVRVSS